MRVTPPPMLAAYGGIEEGRHVDTRDARGPRGPRDAEGGDAESSVNEDRIGARVHEVGRHERVHDRSDHMEALQVAPERRVQEQRRGAERNHAEIRSGHAANLGVEAPPVDGEEHRPRDQHHDGRHAEREHDPLVQPAEAIVVAARAGRARDQRIEAEHQSHPEDHDRGEDAAAHARRPDRGRPEAAHHHSVHEAHAHPPDFGEHDGAGEA